MGLRALIDGDIIARACAHAAESKKFLVLSDYGVVSECDTKEGALMLVEQYGFEIQEVFVPEPVENCLYSVRNMVKSVMDVTGASSCTVFLSGKDNFRKDLYAEYKANRKGTRTPDLLEPAKQFLIDNYDTSVEDGQEADDGMGIAQCNNDDTIICTLDKDLDMIPGKHYNWRSGDVYDIDEKAAIKKFYTQLLTGDRTDNIPGIRGVGPAKAGKILEGGFSEHGFFNKVRVELKRAGYSDDEIVRNARLLWIRRKPDEMWEPPKRKRNGPSTNQQGTSGSSDDSAGTVQPEGSDDSSGSTAEA